MASSGLISWSCFCLFVDSGRRDDEGGFEVYSKKTVRFMFSRNVQGQVIP